MLLSLFGAKFDGHVTSGRRLVVVSLTIWCVNRGPWWGGWFGLRRSRCQWQGLGDFILDFGRFADVRLIGQVLSLR